MDKQPGQQWTKIIIMKLSYFFFFRVLCGRAVIELKDCLALEIKIDNFFFLLFSEGKLFQTAKCAECLPWGARNFISFFILFFASLPMAGSFPLFFSLRNFECLNVNISFFLC